MDKLLLDEQPMLILPKLAKEIGLNESIILQQIHYWIKNNEHKKRNFHDGYYWTYNTFEGWAEQFPFWGERTIKRIFKKLEDEKLLIIGNYNKKSYDRTKWYRIDRIQLEIVATNHSDKVALCIVTEWHDGKCQNGTMDSDRMALTIPETNTETNKRYKDSPKQVYDETSTYFILSNYFYEQIKSNNPGHKEPNLQKWSNDIRLMIEKDNRNKDDIKKIIYWVQQDSFEMANVLSPTKLRKRFDQLMIKVNSSNRESNQAKGQLQYDPRDKEITLQKWIMEGKDPDEFDWSN